MVRGLPFLNPHFLWETNMKQTIKQASIHKDFNQKNLMIERIAHHKAIRINRIGYVGLCFVQLAIIPNLIFGNAILMHTSLLLGLCCYQYRNSHDENELNKRLYSIGNYCGITLNILMLIKLGVML
tara:strand:- start:236 stop:613 length:378 start_codon:yes stop_codon:yes gene_type:complete